MFSERRHIISNEINLLDEFAKDFLLQLRSAGTEWKLFSAF